MSDKISGGSRKQRRRTKVLSLAATRCFRGEHGVRPCGCRRPADCVIFPPLRFHEEDQDPWRQQLAPTGTGGW
jgi:hypothetical protein